MRTLARLFLVSAVLLMGISLFSACSNSPNAVPANAFSSEVSDLSPPSGLTGATWTLLGGRIAVLGSVETNGTTSNLVWLLDPSSRVWSPDIALPRTVDQARLWATPSGCLATGATPAEQWLWIRSETNGSFAVQELPPLAEEPGITAVAKLGSTLYVASAAALPGRPRLHSISLEAPVSWRHHGDVGVALTRVSALAPQSNGERPHLFIFGPSPTGPVAASYEPQRAVWRELSKPPEDIDEAIFTPVGIAHLYAFSPSGQTDTGSTLQIFNTITRVWTRPYTLPTTIGFVAASGVGTHMQALAVDAGGQARLITAHYRVRAEGLHPADYAVILVFVAGLAVMGAVNSARFRSAESYFRGGRKIPWLAAGLSVVATGQSATSFISLPARAFSTNWQFTLLPLTNVFGALIMSRYFVRFFVRLNITSAYEYLHVRFSPLVHTIGSINYLAYELARISLLILVPAVAVSAVTKIDISTAILLMGVVATIYTTTGGLEGVVWADVVQITVKITAILLVVVLIFAQLEGSLFELAGTAWREGKLKTVDWSFDLTRDSIWAMILFWLTDGLKSYVANQTIIQRFISTRDERTAQRSIRASAVAGTLIFWTFMIAGTGLFLFYQQNPGRLDLTMDKPDAVFPWFIVFELPPGIAGFLITALITAALSSLYGALNSTSTVMVTDFYRRFATRPTDVGALRLGRWLTLSVGVLATGLSLLLAGLASRSLVEQTLSVIGLFGGGLGGLFLVGMLTTRVSARAALTGFVVSAIVQYFVSRHTPLHWLTYMFTGMGSCFVASWLASFIWPEKKPLEGLTVHTCAR